MWGNALHQVGLANSFAPGASGKKEKSNNLILDELPLINSVNAAPHVLLFFVQLA